MREQSKRACSRMSRRKDRSAPRPSHKPVSDGALSPDRTDCTVSRFCTDVGSPFNLGKHVWLRMAIFSFDAVILELDEKSAVKRRGYQDPRPAISTPEGHEFFHLDLALEQLDLCAVLLTVDPLSAKDVKRTSGTFVSRPVCKRLL